MMIAMSSIGLRPINQETTEGNTMPTINPTEIRDRHCQQCGSTDYESLETGDQGYSACCNEIVMSECDLRFCSHGCRYPETDDMFAETDCLIHGKGHE